MEAQAQAPNNSTIPPKLRKLLEQCVPQDTILDCSISSGSNPGDNFVSKLVSVQIATASGNQHDLVVKASVPFRRDETLSHEEKLSARLVDAFEFNKTELFFYQQIQPKLRALQDGFELPVPKLYFGQVDEENGGLSACLILDDLRPQGFKMADKLKGLTMDEVTMVLDKLTKFHAVSYVYLQKGQVNLTDHNDPLVIHMFQKSEPIGVGETDKIFCRKLCHEMYQLGKDKQVISDELYHKILKFTDDPRGMILSTSRKATQDYFPVVIHGDLWVNNILFKYDGNGKPADVSFIDFQQSRYASVYDELHYFLYTSITSEFRRKNLAFCLKYYHEKFLVCLKTVLGSDSEEDKVVREFTLEEFLKGYYKYLGAAFCYGVLAIPFQLGIAPPSSQDVDEAKDESKTEEKSSNISQLSDEEDLKKYIAVAFDEMRNSIMAAARNSAVAVQQFGEFCAEMDNLGVFG